MIFRSKPENMNRQAADWLARLHADDRSSRDEAAFHAWLKADPSHARAFENASTIWDAVGGLRDDPRPAPPRQPERVSRRAVMAGGAGLVLTCGLGLGWQQARAGVYETGVGEQRRFVLDDRTRIMLDTNTRVRFTASSSQRLLTLSSGRVDVEIARDVRPFVIEAGDRSAVAQSGRLDLRRDDGVVLITAVQGSAQVQSAGARVELSTGHRIAMEPGRQDKLDRPEIDDLLAWQSGRLAFRDETVAQAVAEMNRYSSRELVVADARAADLRLSGVYRVGDPEAFARSLAVLLPVEIAAEPDVIRIATAR
ncbi:FecR family protein [Novosphingobium kaempferiae]|uniref:FecR family protein n=1 Tax=Novosphingobium kaempferiae TaxID=2896849 RepID=UPI001E397DD4|nr:FecR domain-containing protein [Novosphingobium kaempferiae]